MSKSGQEKARESAALFRAYLDGLASRGESLPLKSSGEVHITRVAQDSGIGSRERCYTNPTLQSMLAAATEALPRPVAPPPAPEPKEVTKRAQRALETRLSRLEQQNAVLMAENSELRRKLAAQGRELERNDYMLSTGRRVAAPSDHS